MQSIAAYGFYGGYTRFSKFIDLSSDQSLQVGVIVL